MHLKRWITSIIILPFLILLILKGDKFLFALFVGIVSVVALREYFSIVFRPKALQNALPVLAYVVSLAFVYAAYENSFNFVVVIIAFNFIFFASFSLFQYGSNPSVLRIMTKQIQGIVYVPILLSFLVLIRNSDNGVIWIFFALAFVFSGDIGAYYIGSYFGKHKLCPAISPNKTIEGSIGGLIANLSVGSIFKYFYLSSSSWSLCIAFFICAGAFGQIGDLFESELKRSANVKDSSKILPGHGGILDRIDALLFVAPIAFFFKEYLC